MRKLKLELEALQVDTFSTGADGGGDGTVEAFRQRTVTGYPLSCWQSCWPEDTCPGCTGTCAANSCAQSCGGTCDATCPDTCPCGGGGTGVECGPENTNATG
ncbi:MAG TPA: hypothetical protein VGO40_08855 [Longimicrobium sp.]|jgi:hypothetical protein|nr:hypothetical protein [Longimicrobium sp.]